MEQDSGLIRDFKNGNQEAFEMLVRKYQNHAVNIAYSLAGNRTDAEDIAQEAFIKVYANIRGFREEAKFSSWLYRIVVNAAYDFLRRKKRHVAVAIEEVEEFIPDGKKPHDLLAKELISEALGKVPFEYRSALTLREIEGLSYEEIAKVLGVSIGTVESRLYRGREILKSILEQKGVFKNEM